MRVPLLVYLGAASQALPLVAALVARRRLGGARAWTLVWCATMVAGNAVSLALGSRHIQNLFVGNLAPPLSAATVLWALSGWQRGEVARLAFRAAIVPLLAAWALITFTLHEFSVFSSVADPMCNLVALGAAAFTLMTRSYHAEGPLHRQDWFWITAGMLLYFGTDAARGPLSALLVGQSPELMNRAYEFKSVLDVFAFLAIARGVTCPAAT